MGIIVSIVYRACGSLEMCPGSIRNAVFHVNNAIVYCFPGRITKIICIKSENKFCSLVWFTYLWYNETEKIMEKLTLEQYTAKIKNRLSKIYTQDELVYIVDRRSLFIKSMFEEGISFIDVANMLKR